MAEWPTFRVEQIERKRDKLFETVFLPYLYQTLDGAALRGIAAILRKSFGGVSHTVLFDSIRYLAGQPFTSEEAARLAWRLAGNTPRLRDGHAVLPWVGQLTDEWVPLRVLQVLAARDPRGKYGIRARLRVLAGTPCPMCISHFWKPAAVRLIARRVGFSAPWGKYPFQAAEQFVLLQLLGKIECTRSAGKPVFYQVECSEAFRKHNREAVLARRFRRVGCPRGWTHACHRCIVGYDQCAGGTHHRTYVTGACAVCGESAAHFDPEQGLSCCVNCHRRARLQVRDE